MGRSRFAVLVKLACGLLTAVLFAAGAAQAAERVALVIGNGAYSNASTLPNPANDAADFAAAMRDLGFETIVATDVDKAGFDQKLRDFARALRGARTALFYYAGHGLQVAGKNYAVPIDAKLEAPADLAVETVELDQILSVMQADEDRVNLVFLDACRDNPLARSFARGLPAARAISVGSGLSALDAGRGTLIAFATAPNKVALDGRGRNSPFTGALLRHIRTPGLDIAFVMRRVTADVESQTGGAQIPWVHASLTTDVMLKAGDGAVPPPAPAPPPLIANANPAAPLTFPTPPLIVPNEPLPGDAPVDPQALRFVETNSFFANAPPIMLASYDLHYVSNGRWAQNGLSGSSTSTSTEDHSVRWLRPGIAATNWLTEGSTTDSRGSTSSVTSRGNSVLAGNGLIQLGLKQVSPNGRRSFTNTSRLLRIENIQGRLFPVEVGNRFSFDEVNNWRTSMGFNDDFTRTTSCEVSRKYDAGAFHPGLTGAAYLALCRYDTVWKKNKSSNGRSQQKMVFFESMGYWLGVDPMLPREKLADNTDVTTILTSTTTYSLRAFTLSR